MSLSNLSNFESGTGAMLKPSPNPKVDNFQSDKWKGNFHLKDKDTGIIFESFESLFSRIEQNILPLCDKYIFGEEYGDSGDTPHIEFAFTIKGGKRLRRDKLLKIFNHPKHMYLDRMKGTLEQQKYCAKEGNKVLSNIKFKKAKKALKVLPTTNPENLKWWQKDILKILDNEVDDRIIYWYWSKEGNMGKTTFARHIYREYDYACINGGKAADMKNCIAEFMEVNDNYTPEIVIMNIPKSFDKEYLSYHGIEECKDMFFHSGKYKGKMVDGNPPHFFIFANVEPDLAKMTDNRWNIVNVDEEDYESDTDYGVVEKN